MKRLLFMGLLALMAGCKSSQQVQVVTKTLHDTVVSNMVRYDSVFIDQTRETHTLHDTVFRDRTRTEYRLRLVHDTTLVSRCDTIPITVVTDRQVPYTPWYAKALAWYGVGSLLFLILYILWKRKLLNISH